MAFFSRPNLSDEQFKQVIDTTLSLSGQTNIINPSGLTITGDNNLKIPIILTGGTDNKVLTYLGGKMILSDNSSSGGTYVGKSPTTCTVGGLPTGSEIYGCSVTCILQDILVPTTYPTFTNPSSVFTVTNGSNYVEVGNIISVDTVSTFNRGTINPSYGTSGYRSGLPILYEYNVWGNTSTFNNTGLVDNRTFDNHEVTLGNNTLSNRVCYSIGEQPLDSDGDNYCAPLPESKTNFNSISLCGIYPFYYGIIASGGVPAGVNRPTITKNTITGGTKVVSSSNETIIINFNSTVDDYVWVAIPSTSSDKTKWFINDFNNGNIGGSVSVGGNLFPDKDLVTNVSSQYWAGLTYKVYLSNYQTQINTNIQIKNN